MLLGGRRGRRREGGWMMDARLFLRMLLDCLEDAVRLSYGCELSGIFLSR